MAYTQNHGYDILPNGALRYEGSAVVVARGAEEAIEAIELYLDGRLVCLR